MRVGGGQLRRGLTPSPGFAGSSPLGEQLALSFLPIRGRWTAKRAGGGKLRRGLTTSPGFAGSSPLGEQLAL
jgi:hypothetical protein